MIPSEEMKIAVHPMDFEEFQSAIQGNTYQLRKEVYKSGKNAAGHELYYHTWDKEKSTHYYEIDFLISQGAKVKAIEVKSSGVVRHESLKIFRKKYSKVLASSILVSSKDRKTEDGIDFLPVYMLDFAANNIEIN